jgi:hypothetical protein
LINQSLRSVEGLEILAGAVHAALTPYLPARTVPQASAE